MLENNEPLRKAFQDAASYLSGKDITLQFRRPAGKPGKWTRGEFYYDAGKFYIDIDPDLTPLQAYATALHEIAHAKRHAAIAQTVAPRTVQAAQGIERVNIPTFENEADSLAEKWFTWARYYADVKTMQPETVKAILLMRSLLSYKET